MKHHVFFICESEGQLTGSDCCGKLEGDWRFDQGMSLFAEQRHLLQRLSPLDRALRDRFGPVLEIVHVDPRNVSYLFPQLLRDWFRFRSFSIARLRALLFLFRLPAIVMDGELLFSGVVPEQKTLLLEVEKRLHEAAGWS